MERKYTKCQIMLATPISLSYTTQDIIYHVMCYVTWDIIFTHSDILYYKD